MMWREWEIRAPLRFIDVHEDIAVPERVWASGPLDRAPQAEARENPCQEFHIQTEAVYSQSLGHYVMHAFTLLAPDDEEVTGAVLRTVTPLGIMRRVLPQSFRISRSVLSGPVRDFVSSHVETVTGGKTGNMARRTELSDVATVYRLASIVRYPPVKAVAETFGFQTRTASNWIARARASDA